MNMQEILDKLKVDFEYITGGKYIGLVKSIGAGFASRISEFNSKLKWIEKQAFVATADKDYLYLHTGHLLSPKPALVSEGYVVFLGEINKEVPSGLIIKDENGSFKTLVSGKIVKHEFSGNVSVTDGIASLPPQIEVPSCECVVNGISKTATSSKESFTFDAGRLANNEAVVVFVNKSGLVPVKSTKAGVCGNRNLSDKLKTTVTIEGLNKEVGVVTIAGGEDDESVDSYRKRVQYWQANPQAPFSENHIKAFLLKEVPTLKYVWVKGGEVEDGKVKILVINRENGLTAAESKKVVDLIKGIKPPQMKPDYITTGLPIIRTIDVVISDLLPASEQMKSEVEKNIKYLFNVDLFEKGVSKDEIKSTIYRTKLEGEHASNFVLESGECVAGTYTFWKLGQVSFQ